MPDWHEADEARLLELAQNDGTEVFGQLYERHAGTIFRFVFAHLGNRLDAEDLTEEVFLRAWRSLHRYRAQGVPFQAFLFRIARNALIDYYRHSGHIEPQLSTDNTTIPDLRYEPGEVLASNQDRQDLKLLLGQLREDYRTVLILRFLNELSPEETAQVMERSTGAVRVLQHRALSALRKHLERYNEGFGEKKLSSD